MSVKQWDKQKSNILFVDTSTAFAYIAYLQLKEDRFFKYNDILFSLREKRKVFSTLQDEIKIRGDAWLYGLLNKIIPERSFHEIDLIALGRGPGFFTSLRIGHSMLRTLGMLRGVEFLSFSSMEFWHNVFSLEWKDIFLFRLNRNLYYGYIAQEEPSFRALTQQEWLDLLKEKNRTAKINEKRKLNIWLETWEAKGIEPRINKTWPEDVHELKISKIEDISTDVFQMLLDLKPVSWEKALPEYGHHVI